MIQESCIYGDYRGRFQVAATTTLNCTEIGLQQPWRCYDNSYSTDCCQTCVDVRNTSYPAGEFLLLLLLLLLLYVIKAEICATSTVRNKINHRNGAEICHWGKKTGKLPTWRACDAVSYAEAFNKQKEAMNLAAHLLPSPTVKEVENRSTFPKVGVA